MKSEYLIFNVIVMIIPLVMSFEKKVYYFREWKSVFQAIFIPFLLFTVWDTIVAGRHWWFNEEYVLGVEIANLPLEEWLFFITIPFSSLLIWIVLKFYLKNKKVHGFSKLTPFSLILIPLGVLTFFLSGEYTGITVVILGMIFWLDSFLKTKIFQQIQTYYFLIVIVILIFTFNGYLTWRPVVLYNEDFQSGIRVFTIPIEDFFYGISYILLCTIFYERIKNGKIE